MQIVAVDSTRLTILMVAGGFFAVAGILLMFRAKQEGRAAKFELLGQRFEASSAGIIVFLMGSVFLAAPMFVPERPSSATSRSTGPEISGAGSAIDPPTQDVASIRPTPVNKGEVERNDSISAATVPDVGQTVSGEAQAGDVDWFAVAVDPKGGKTLRVVFHPRGGFCPWYNVLDGDENVVHSEQVCGVSDTADVPVKSDRYFVQIDPRDTATSYELAIRYE